MSADSWDWSELGAAQALLSAALGPIPLGRVTQGQLPLVDSILG
jgi:hypothetical protein